MATPSLNGLRAFEAAARYCSFAKAGETLGVGSTAVSLHVKRLEDHFGKKLFLRQGNKLSLTSVGESLFISLEDAFRQIDSISRQTASDARFPNLIVSVLPSFCEPWVLPFILRFKAMTGISIELRAEEDPVAFEQPGIDFRITYSGDIYQQHEVIPLFTDIAIPVCSPGFWGNHQCKDDFLTNILPSQLIHSDWGAELVSEASWHQWWYHSGRGELDVNHAGLIFNRTSDAIAAAVAGAGILLAPQSLTKVHINDGRLVSPTSEHLVMSSPYVCLYPSGRKHSKVKERFLKELCDWSKVGF